MTLNGVMAVILRYFTELMYDVVVKQLPRFQNLLLIACDSTEEYRSQFMDTLCAIGEIIDQHSSSKVVIGGDFNLSLIHI